MKAIRVIYVTGLLFLAIVFCFSSVEAPCAELQPIQVELVSSLPSFTGAETICLVPVFKLSNPNRQMISATIDYTLIRGGQELGSAQMQPVYIPGGKSIHQRDSMVVEYLAWFAKENSRPMSKAAEVLKIILPLWKGMDGKEPAKLPEGLWTQVQAKALPMVADGSVTVSAEDGTEQIFFFKGIKELEE